MVMLHGFSGSRQELLGATPLYWNLGCDLLMYDARGHGDSSPSLLTYGAHEKDDLARAVDWLATKTSLPHKKIGLAGWSYGAATALQAAADIPDLGLVVTDSSYSSLGDIARAQGRSQFGDWTKYFVPGALLVSVSVPVSTLVASHPTRRFVTSTNRRCWSIPVRTSSPPSNSPRRSTPTATTTTPNW